MREKEDYLNFEEDYFSKDRKTSRKERKRVASKDRSKFKKTDLAKHKEQKGEEYIPSLLCGRVLSITPDGICVDCEGRQFLCTLKGVLKKHTTRLKNLIAVGDIVWFEKKEQGQASIAKIAKRTSILSRADTLSKTKEQLIAVNIDQVVITCSVVAPALKPFLVDRYIIAARKGNMKPIIVVNKIDLLHTPPPYCHLESIEKEKELLFAFLNIYRSLGLTVIPMSTISSEGIEDLKKIMQGKTSVFSGQSGVGKSKLITLITGCPLPTGEIVKKTYKGAHTTTAAHLLCFGKNSFCIDTPGIKSFGLWDLKRDEIKEYFSEIHAISPNCKFFDCNHIHEPDCAVKRAVEGGTISSLRFASYCALMACLKEEHGRR